VRLVKTHDSVGDASAPGIAENCLLTHQLADNQQLFVPVLSSRQKACTIGGWAVHAGWVPLEMAEVLLDRFGDCVDGSELLLGNGKKLLPGFITLDMRLGIENVSNMRLHPVDQFLRDLALASLRRDRSVRQRMSAETQLASINSAPCLADCCLACWP
jgi:hypothetical protein